MVTVFGILNLTEDSFFDESRRLDPAGAVTAAIEMLRVGSDVVDVGPAASHPDARPVSPADEIRRIAPLLDALSDQMHRVWHCCKVSDEAAFCLIQRPYISKTLLTRRISP
ncbi:dihydropteroate synthase, partial [Escherichia coli]|uniref:dihydropteroate synthase n=8 Tax=Escherichia coli TaxID=562 RepID=UPI0034A32E0F